MPWWPRDFAADDGAARPWEQPDAWRYFCGVCWRMIKEGGGNGQEP
jgi:hypothetical protein